MMHGDSRVMVVVRLETASLPAPCLSTSTSPRSREVPPISPQSNCRSSPSQTMKCRDAQAGAPKARGAAQS